MDIKSFLQNLPNSVSGDGKSFVAILKKSLYAVIEEIENMVTNKEQVSSLTLSEQNRVIDNVRYNDIKVMWSTLGLEDYAKAEIWYKEISDEEWKKDGEAAEGLVHQYTIEGVDAGKTYSVMVVAVNSKGASASFDEAPTKNITILGSQCAPAAPSQFLLTWDSQGPKWQWNIDDDSRIDYFELRLDQNPGVWNDKCLGRTKEVYSRANPGIRSGTAYLYAKNIFGEYSTPTTHAFNKAKPAKPASLVVTGITDGVSIKMAALPQDCSGYKLHIKVTKEGSTVEGYFETVNSEYTYSALDGTIEVSYAFTDAIGDGEWSDIVYGTIKELTVTGGNIQQGAVSTAQIADGSVTESKLKNGAIQMTGARAIVGGAARLDESGITVSTSDGGNILLNSSGMSYTSSDKSQFTMAKRIMVGNAAHGDKVKFANSWGIVPFVICVPTNIDISSDVTLVCAPADITANGFTVQCYTTSADGATVSTGRVRFLCIDVSADYAIE